MSRKIIGVTVGTPLSLNKIEEKINPKLTSAVENALKEAKEKGEFDYRLTPSDKTEIAEMAAELVDVPDSGGNVDLTGYATEQWVKDQNYLTEHQDISGKLDADKLPEEVNPLIDTKLHSVMTYGATGDGVTNDTKAFLDALENNRIVTVPGGTYVLSDTLVIRENCCLELSQDTVLQFTQTTGNCIEMRGSAVLRGNRAVLSAAFGLTDKVISMDTLQDGTNHASIPPYTKADPQWKRQRFVYDVNIIKPNSSGFNRPLADGVCRGTAIYMSATNVPAGTDNPNNADIPFMWGITMSGVRIAGGFSYGIHAINYDTPAGSSGHYADDAWNHDMRIEAIVEGCEIGVCLENCNGAHLNVTVQPNVSNPGGTKYAKQGVCLKDSRFVDMMRSRVWDWNVARTDSPEYQHLALYGNCKGLLLDDFLVHEHPNMDIREQIYTDTPSNFDSMTILQEPGNKWFKNVDGVPKFFDGTSDKTLMLKTDKFSAEQAEFIKPADGYYTYEPRFKNLVKGYTDGVYLAGSSTSTIADNYTTTDFIPIDGGTSHVYRIGGEGITWDDSYGYCRIAWYNADKSLKGSVMAWNKIGSSIYYPEWVEDETVAAAFATNANVVAPSGAAYFRITAKGKGANLIVTIDEPQEYTAIWHGEPKRLDESIHAKNDWNASESEVGYIENRTHYSKYEDVTFLDNVTIPPGDETTYDIVLTDGETYRVVWNGVEYHETAYAVDIEGIIGVALGNGEIVGSDINKDIPWNILYASVIGGANVFDMSGSETDSIVSIFGKVETVQQIPSKYIPEMQPYYVEVFYDGESYNTAVTREKMESLYNSGRYLICKMYKDNIVFFIPLYTWTGEGHCAFSLGNQIVTFVPNSDGYYTVGV